MSVMADHLKMIMKQLGITYYIITIVKKKKEKITIVHNKICMLL